MISIEKFGEQTEYGKKNIQAGDKFAVLVYEAECTYSTDQVLRFRLTRGEKEVLIEKRLLQNKRQPWRLLKANFEFEGDKAGKNLIDLFYHIDDYLQPKSRYDRR